jgi:hypothetical protein
MVTKNSTDQEIASISPCAVISTIVTWRTLFKRIMRFKKKKKERSEGYYNQ